MCHTKHFRGAIFHPSHLLVLHRRHIPFQTGRRVAFQVSDAVVSVTFTISVFPRGHDIKSPQIADPRPPSPFSTITPGGWLRVPKGKKKGDANAPFLRCAPLGREKMELQDWAQCPPLSAMTTPQPQQTWQTNGIPCFIPSGDQSFLFLAQFCFVYCF